jgi:E1A/CREB-binding protein
LLGRYCRSINYHWCHIWACPPSPGDDYIFYCHPPDQKVPKPTRLQEWYRIMLMSAKKKMVIHEWYDLNE